MVIVVMGVSGCGKTTVGTLLAGILGVPFYDADNFHPASNIALMKAGIPLTDKTRMPWLELLAARIETWNTSAGAILACSALKASYRTHLAGRNPEAVRFLYLAGTMEQVAERMESRKGHFMPAGLIESQFAALEPPEEALTYSIALSSEQIAHSAAAVVREHYAAVQ